MIYGSGKRPHPGFKANFRVYVLRQAQDARSAPLIPSLSRDDVTGFVPDPYRHESVSYGEYATPCATGADAALLLRATRRSSSQARISRWESWRELLKRVYEVDPLACACGGQLKVVA